MPDCLRPARFVPPTCLALTLLLAACGQSELQATTAELHPQEISEGSATWTAPADRPSLEEGEAPLPEIGIDPGVFLNQPGTDNTDAAALGRAILTSEPAHSDLTSQATYLSCRNEPSGPYLRIQTDPQRTGAVNFVGGTAHLPAVRAMPTAFPYIYLGGQPREGVAADAGVYVNYDGSWIPFVAVAGSGGTRNIPRETDAHGRVFVYRLDGNQDVGLRMSVLRDDQLTLDITGSWVKFRLTGTTLTRVSEVGVSTRTIVHPLARGWKASGEDQVYKVMTTIAFPGKGNFRYLSGDYTFTGSSWRDLTVGHTAFQGTGQSLPLTRGRLYSACAAPHDVVTPRPTSALPRAQADIRLRRPAGLSLLPGHDLSYQAKVMHTVRDTLTLGNVGQAGSFVHYTLTPPGREQATRPEAGRLGSGEQARVDFAAICDKQPGWTVQDFDVLSSRGETYTPTSGPSALPGAQYGDLLFRKSRVTVNLECTEK